MVRLARMMSPEQLKEMQGAQQQIVVNPKSVAAQVPTRNAALQAAPDPGAECEKAAPAIGNQR